MVEGERRAAACGAGLDAIVASPASRNGCELVVGELEAVGLGKLEYLLGIGRRLDGELLLPGEVLVLHACSFSAAVTRACLCPPYGRIAGSVPRYTSWEASGRTMMGMFESVSMTVSGT